MGGGCVRSIYAGQLSRFKLCTLSYCVEGPTHRPAPPNTRDFIKFGSPDQIKTKKYLAHLSTGPPPKTATRVRAHQNPCSQFRIFSRQRSGSVYTPKVIIIMALRKHAVWTTRPKSASSEKTKNGIFVEMFLDLFMRSFSQQNAF